MRALKIGFAFFLLGALALWIRDGRGFCVLDALPYVERSDRLSSDYDILALAAIAIGAWGCFMIARNRPPETLPQKPGFRREVILVPLGLFFVAAIAQRLKPALSFADVTGPSPKHLDHVYLAVLCTAIYAVVLAVLWFRRP
ncbi:MAG: hypothetical protein H6819_07010 [Phycisphaerales bacterium]|nr:hypothetical protein [Phycisphaerales bacterium]MCB9855331.1 hypothetical protein [Phycisphaerales bacterium]MCB9862924.1 hypothetical protein [Phycisphaerales bacterium]